MNIRRFRKAIKRIFLLPKNKYLIKYLTNKVKHFYYKLTKSTKVAFPSTIMLELTNRCNLACTTCPREYEYGQAMAQGDISVNQAKKIIDELWYNLDSIGLTGMGETFLYKEIEEIVDYIKSKNRGIIVSVSTNAMLPKFIEKVKPLIGKVDTIQISIDGLNDVYEQIRVNAKFSRLVENLKQLKELSTGTSTELMLNMVVTKENYFQMVDLVGFAENIGVKYMDFTKFNLASVTKIDLSYYDFYNTDEFKFALQKLEEKTKQTQNVVVSYHSFYEKGAFHNCGFPFSHFYVCWNGLVAPCCAKPFPKEKNFGNVFESSVMQILNGQSFQQWRKMWYKNKTPDFCKKCHIVE